jgi:hypothetical protein
VNRWLAEPITRAEAIGWALTVPASCYAAVGGITIASVLPAIEPMAQRYPDELPPLLNVYLQMGATGVVIGFGLLIVLALGAQLARQRPWVRVLAPVLCATLAWQGQSLFLSSFREFGKIVGLLHGAAAVEGLPK